MDGKDNMLARVSIVNAFGETVYDSFVAPMQKVVDYRTKYSGVRPENLINGWCNIWISKSTFVDEN